MIRILLTDTIALVGLGSDVKLNCFVALISQVIKKKQWRLPKAKDLWRKTRKKYWSLLTTGNSLNPNITLPWWHFGVEVGSVILFFFFLHLRKVGKRKAVAEVNKSSGKLAKNSKSAKKDPNKPKKPASAFFVFL